MIEPLAETEMLHAIVVGKKLNELIEAFNEFRAQMYPLEATIETDRTVTWRVRTEWPSHPSL